MIVSETSHRVNSRWLQACVLLLAVALLPLGLAYAQDYEAVEKRLGEAVSKGELSLEQAAVMLDALKESAEDDDHDEKDEDDIQRRFEGWIESVGEKLKEAVDRGKLSEKDAWKKWRHFKENELAPKLKAAVASREVSEKWASSLWQGLERAEDGERLKAAVAKGELTEKEAWAKWKGVNKDHGKDDRGAKSKGKLSEAEIAEIGKKIKAAITAGKITIEEGRAKMAAMRKMIDERSESAEEFGHDGSPLRNRASKKSEDWQGIKNRIEGAVKSGDMTREEADAKYKEIRKQMTEHRERGGERPDWDAIDRRIEGAVKRGDITREEADAKYRELKK